MNIEKTRQAIMVAFEAGWTGDDALKVQRPNQKWKQPETDSWGRLNFNFGSRNSAALGRSLTRQTALLELQLFQAEDAGTAEINRAAELFATIFDDLQLRPETGLLIEFEQAGIVTAGTRHGWQQIIATISFRIDKRRLNV